MKNQLKFAALLLVISLIMGITGCKSEEDGNKDEIDAYAQYYEEDFRNNKNGTVELVNTTSHDMLLFGSNFISLDNIVGGVKAGATININFSDKNDFLVGGFTILYVVKQSEFLEHEEYSRITDSVMVSYGQGRSLKVNVISTTDGQYEYIVNNTSNDFALELRKHSPNGEKVALLSRGEMYRTINCSNNEMFTLYPVWIAYNTLTRSIVTFSPGGASEARDVTPAMPPAMMPIINFHPLDMSNIEIPYAIIRVANSFPYMIVFRMGDSVLSDDSGYATGINPGSYRRYEIISTGTGLNPNIFLPHASITIPVRFEEDPGVDSVIIENGFIYNVFFNLKTGSDQISEPSSYEAWLVKGDKINDFLISF